MRTIFYLLCAMGLFAQEYETQNYRVLGQLDDAEVRYYPEVMKAKTEGPLSSNGNFSKLFNYIAKGNASSTKIAMTTPVYMQQNSELSQMEFVLPRKYLSEKAPSPIRSDVVVYKARAGFFVALEFGGYNNASKTAKYRRQLEKILESNNINPQGPLKVLGYNSPLTVFNRRNEVLFEVQEESLPEAFRDSKKD